ncbi:MAG TPA: class F sortase [Candidatus Paceibacterota bacterium]|nr:class F sortase [Candidatus Paceibacterota bacterium]
MNTEKTKRVAIGIITALAGTVFVVTLIQAVFYSPNGEIELPQYAVPTVVSTTTGALPTRLSIPRLGIDTNVQLVGITASHNMATPHGFSDVGWYKYGTVPGNIGSAVIAGHVDNGLGLAGVFKHLNQIQRGDDIYVTNSQGEKLHFTVDRVEAFDYQNVPTDTIFNRSNAAHLNLITCEGVWVPSDRTYDHRLVVFSTLRSV